MGASQALMNTEELYKDFILLNTPVMGKQTTKTGQVIFHTIFQTPVAEKQLVSRLSTACVLSACCLCVSSLQLISLFEHWKYSQVGLGDFSSLTTRLGISVSHGEKLLLWYRIANDAAEIEINQSELTPCVLRGCFSPGRSDTFLPKSALMSKQG